MSFVILPEALLRLRFIAVKSLFVACGTSNKQDVLFHAFCIVRQVYYITPIFYVSIPKSQIIASDF